MPAETLAMDSGLRQAQSMREWIEERAAILEFDAGYTRQDAERIAEQLWIALVAAND